MWTSLLSLSLAVAYLGTTPTEAGPARLGGRDNADAKHHHLVRRGPNWKKGISMGALERIRPFQGKVGWTFNWRNDLDASQLPNGIQYFPQLWSLKPEHTNNWHQNALAAIARDDKVLFSFNEPQEDQCGRQACMIPSIAAKEFRERITPLKSVDSSVTLVAPSITAEGGPVNGVWAGKGIDYLKEFIDLCGDCKVDAVAVNFYGHDLEAFKIFVETAHSVSGGKPVWVTEWSFPDGYDPKTPANLETSKRFIKDAVAWLDNNNHVQGYAYFWVVGAVDQVGQTSPFVLNEIGKAYVGE